MNNYHILITGGASGIGLGMAEYLASLNHHIIIADLNLESAQQAAQHLIAQGGQGTAIKLDVSNNQEIEDFAASSLGQRVDVLINNAGIQHVARLEDFPADKWQLLINVMLVGPAMLTRALLPTMRQKGFGRIINVGSIHSLVASPFKSAYVAAKHGLLGLSKVIALENGDTDITINTLCPSYVKTPLVEQQIAAQARENHLTEQQVIEKIMLEPMPKKAFIDIQELAETAAFLLSPAARNITAQTMVLDGGWVAR